MHPDAAEYPPPGLAAQNFQFTRQGIGFNETFSESVPDQVPFIVGGLLPQTSFGIAGAGGSMKSSTMLRIMMHVVLGKQVFGREVLQGGPCVFVSAEDDMRTIRFRVRVMADAMGLTKAEKRVLARDLIIEDASGSIARLVEQDDRSNLRYASTVDQLLDKYDGGEYSILCFDPMVYFGPGENYVNDGPALLMNLARKLSGELQCATGFLHHTGQEAFRNNLVDMYSGRGGTAFADNARMVGVMTHPVSPQKYPVPEEVRTLMTAKPDLQAVQLHVPKISFARPPGQPLWIARDPLDIWRFHDVWGYAVGTDVREAEREENEMKTRLAILADIWRHLGEEAEEGRYPNKTTVREKLIVKIDGRKVSKQRMSDMVELGVLHGFIREEELPDDKKQGARKYYLMPMTRPFIGTGGLGAEVVGTGE